MKLDVESFSTPHWQVPPAFFPTVSQAYGRAVGRHLRAQLLGAAKSPSLTTLAEAVAVASAHIPQTCYAWRVEFGLAQRRQRFARGGGEESEWLLAGLQYLLGAAALGVPVQARVDVEDVGSTALNVEGICVPIEGACSIDLSADRESLRVAVGDQRVELQRDAIDAERLVLRGGDLPQADSVVLTSDSFCKRIWLPEGEMCKRAGLWLHEGDPPLTAKLSPGEYYSRGFELVRKRTPEYGDWILRSLDVLVPLAVDPQGRHFNGSTQCRPGLVSLSLPLSELTIGEALVHECSHQHFYMMETMAPVEDGSDTDLYFSPFRPDQKRPIHAIATSYHACANMVLYYRKLTADAVTTHLGEAERKRLEYEQYLRAFESALDRTVGLTPRGRAFSNRITEVLRSDLGAAA